MTFKITRNRSSIARITAAGCLAVALAIGQTAWAGYPVVTQIGDTLYIDGDNFDNTVTIIGANGDEFEDPGGGETEGVVAVYSHPDPSIHEGVVHIEVDLGGGDNVLKMARLDIAGNMTVTTGDGRDYVIVNGFQSYAASSIAGDFTVTTGDGWDDIWVDNSWIGGNVNFETGGGWDQIVIGEAKSHLTESVGVTIDGNLVVMTGAGDDIDEVFIKRTLLDEALIDTGGGEDWVLLGLDFGDAPRPIEAPDRDPNDITSRDGDSRPDTTRDLTANRRTVPDIPPNVFNRLYLYTGSDRDVVRLMGNVINLETQIQLQQGNDDLIIRAPNELKGDVSAHGGAGDDVLINEPENYYEFPPTFLSF